MPRASLLFVFAPFAFATAACSDGAGGTGGQGGGGGDPVTLRPGDVCYPPTSSQKLRFEPSRVYLPACDGGASCVTRKVNVIFDPDICEDIPVTFSSGDAGVAPPPDTATLGLYKQSVTVEVRAGATLGSTVLTATAPAGTKDASASVTAELEVVVLDDQVPSCSGTASDLLAGGGSVAGTGDLAGASISMPAGADAPNEGSFLWSVQPFTADVACGTDGVPDGYLALGPAITFGPEDLSLPRELPMSVPVNPALLPAAARFRHVEVVYSGPAFPEPRIVPVADLRLLPAGSRWALHFQAPRLGTYQAVVRADAGTKTFQRRMTYRAVIGVSMGGGGSAMFGMRHHDKFDVIAPLGGPVDWTWMLDHIERNHMGGFRPIPPGTQLQDIQLTSTPCTGPADCAGDETCLVETDTEPGRCVLLPTPRDPYEHPSTFNHWWLEYPKTGTGGSFPRDEYAQIFRDLALMFGNPNSENLTPGAENLPAGVRPDDPSVLGNHPNEECKVWVDPLDGPDKAKQEEIAQNCPLERCANTLTLQGYYDDEFNPDGTFPVITFCDGSPQESKWSPYANTWSPNGNDYPLELALAVDYNGNGVRDELEPVIRGGHERFDDWGTDGVPSALEPGYVPGVNEDPNGDDYNPQYNPSGTERDMRWEAGEPFDDLGLDGVAGTAQQPAGGWQQPGDGYDVGEGDGQFTMSRGLRRFLDRDSHSIVRRVTQDLPGGELDDDALRRIDVWTDGGTRDLFNFAVSAQHLVGTFRGRGRSVTYLTKFTSLAGLDPDNTNDYAPGRVVWEDVPGVVMQRYGKPEPNALDIENGSGQHVGTVAEIASRLQSGLYFIGSRWAEPELMTQVEETSMDPEPGIDDCQYVGNCTFDFTSTFGRTGVVTVSLPPGYGNAKQQDRRYPVIYMLHGYGQTPDDLAAAIVFLKNWMNNPTEGVASRLPKAILVYVDGRCRIGADGKAECIRGSFYADSPREGGLQDESWWLELMDYVDQNYRTKPEELVEWTE